MFAVTTWVLFHTRFVRNFMLKISQWRLDSNRTLKIQRLKTSKITMTVFREAIFRFHQSTLKIFLTYLFRKMKMITLKLVGVVMILQ